MKSCVDYTFRFSDPRKTTMSIQIIGFVGLRTNLIGVLIMIASCYLALSQSITPIPKPLDPLQKQQVDSIARDAIEDGGGSSHRSNIVRSANPNPWSGMAERIAEHRLRVEEQFAQCEAVWRQEINLAKRLLAGSKLEEAAQAAIDALDYCRQNLRTDSWYEIENLTILGNIYNAQSNPTKAFQMHREVLDIRLRQSSPDYVDIGDQCAFLSTYSNANGWTEVCSEYNQLALKYWRRAYFSYLNSYSTEKKREKYDYAHLSTLCHNLSVTAKRLSDERATWFWAQEHKKWQRKLGN